MSASPSIAFQSQIGNPRPFVIDKDGPRWSFSVPAEVVWIVRLISFFIPFVGPGLALMWDVTKATTADITRPLRVATWIVLVALFVRFSIWFLGEELVIETVVKFIVGLIGGRS